MDAGRYLASAMARPYWSLQPPMLEGDRFRSTAPRRWRYQPSEGSVGCRPIPAPPERSVTTRTSHRQVLRSRARGVASTRRSGAGA